MGSRVGHAVQLKALHLSQDRLKFDPVTRRVLQPSIRWAKLGSSTCGWAAPASWDVSQPVAYCVGAGEDISFDLALSKEKGCEVRIFDPTPRAIEHVEGQLGEAPGNVSLHPWAVWHEDAEVRLFAPKNAAHVSHSIVNLQQTDESFVAMGRSIGSIAAEFGHRRIDLLKIDAEGAEYKILSSILDSGVEVGVLNVEFDELSWPRRGAWGRIRRMVDRLYAAGFALELVDSSSNYTFLRASYRDQLN